MLALHVKKDSSEEVKGLVTRAEKCASGVNSLAPFVADCGLQGALQPVFPRRNSLCPLQWSGRHGTLASSSFPRRALWEDEWRVASWKCLKTLCK